MDRVKRQRHHLYAAQLPAGGRGGQAARQLLLLRYLATEDRWVTAAELLEALYGGAYRTLYRDLNQLRAVGLPLEHDESHELGWRLRARTAVEWLIGGHRRAVAELKRVRGK